MQTQTGDRLLKISEVAHLAQTSLTTAKYYAREGLIEPACKTSPNMAYYAPACVERMRLIKTLQSEKFYPLAVIKRMLQSGGAGEAELLYTINKADRDDYYEPISFSGALREAGLKPREAEILVQAGVVASTLRGRLRCCCKGDLRVMQLAKRRLDAGIPLAQTAQTFAMYDRRLRDATRRDIESLITAGMLSGTLRTEEIVRMINVSDETLDDFIEGKRYAYNAALGAQYLSELETVFGALTGYVQRLYALLEQAGFGPLSRELRSAMSGGSVDETLTCYADLLHLTDKPIADSLVALSRADSVLGKPLAKTGDDVCDTVRGALALRWLTVAPAEFGYDRQRAPLDFLAAAPNPTLALRAVDPL